jgi:photosystem II stability/assembly factor-like uncharacterized protein
MVRERVLLVSFLLLAVTGIHAQQAMVPDPQPPSLEKAKPAGRWRVLPIRSEEEVNLGLKGGEAEQHPHGMARSIADPDIIYLSHDVGGVWRSRDGGETWAKALDKGLFVRAGQSIEVDPVDPSIVLFEADNSWNWLASGYEGLFRSTNGGDDWDLVLQTDTHYDSGKHRLYRHNIAFDPSSVSGDRAERWYAAFPDHEVFRSEDGGESWTPVCPLAGHDIVYALHAHPSDGQTVYLATSLGLFVSHDRGENFLPLGNLPAGEVSSIAIHSTVLYVTVLDNGLYRSTNGGAAFSLVRAFDAARVFINPGYPDTVYLVGSSSNTVITHDGGNTWIEDMETRPAPGLGREGSWKSRIAGQLTGIVPDPEDPDEAVAFSRATLWKTVDGGHLFKDSSTGFTGFAWSWWNCGAAFDPLDPDRMAFFNCDVGMTITHNGGLWFERRNDQAWGWYDASLITWIGTYAGSFQPLPFSQRIVASVGGYFTTKLMNTFDEGEHWNLPPAQNDERNLFIAFHPNDPDLVYAGKKISLDGGATFQDVDFSVYGTLDPAILGMCGAQPDTVYAVSEDRRRILRSDDRGTSWSEYVHAGWTFTKLDSLPTFAADPVDPDRIYTIDSQGDLAFYDGQSWTSTGVLALAGGTHYGNFVRTVAVDPNDNQVVYAGMFANGLSCIWRSLDRGETWQDITENLPRAGMSAMAVNPHTSELYKGSAIGTWIHPAPGR